MPHVPAATTATVTTQNTSTFHPVTDPAASSAPSSGACTSTPSPPLRIRRTKDSGDNPAPNRANANPVKRPVEKQTEHKLKDFPYEFDAAEQKHLDEMKAAWAARPPSLWSRTTMEWQNEQFRWLPLLAIASSTDRENTFDEMRDEADWAYTSAAKYWSAANRAAQDLDCKVDMSMRAKLRQLICLSKEESPKCPTVALTVEHYHQLPTLLNEVDTLACETSFLLGQRIGDTHQLPQEAISTIADKRSGLEFLTVLYRKGKTTRRRQPFTLHLPRNTDMAERLLQRSASLQRGELLFGDLAGSSGDNIRAALTRLNPLYTLLSIRRGGLQDMAQQGVSTGSLLMHSRHASIETLHRYLEWGKLSFDAARERFAGNLPWNMALHLTATNSPDGTTQ